MFGRVTRPDDLAVNGGGMFLVDALSKEWGIPRGPLTER
jgi:hypothetical protein